MALSDDELDEQKWAVAHKKQELLFLNRELLKNICNHLEIEGQPFQVDSFADSLRITGGGREQTAELEKRLRGLEILEGLSVSTRSNPYLCEEWLYLKGRERLESPALCIVLNKALGNVTTERTNTKIDALRLAQEKYIEESAERPPSGANYAPGKLIA